jgi:hypothetical protein
MEIHLETKVAGKGEIVLLEALPQQPANKHEHKEEASGVGHKMPDV